MVSGGRLVEAADEAASFTRNFETTYKIYYVK
jgi:hypothetical protein